MADLKKLVIKLGTGGPVKILPTPRLVQLQFNGLIFLKTTNAQYVWEHPYYPQFYVPRSELVESAKQTALEIVEGDAIRADDGQPLAHHLTLKVGSKSTDRAVAFGDALAGPAAPLRGLVKVDFDAIDQWFEEDTPIAVHPKDPFKRIDVLQSQRRVRVAIDGVTVADAVTAMHLHETGLPRRFYLPRTAVDPSVLRPSATRTRCPYKGEAEYYSVEVNGKLHEDVVWYYDRPTLESGLIVGLVCFYNEKVDIELDGQKLERPQTHFSNTKPGAKPPL